jgi:hypothetical protein
MRRDREHRPEGNADRAAAERRLDQDGGRPNSGRHVEQRREQGVGRSAAAQLPELRIPRIVHDLPEGKGGSFPLIDQRLLADLCAQEDRLGDRSGDCRRQQDASPSGCGRNIRQRGAGTPQHSRHPSHSRPEQSQTPDTLALRFCSVRFGAVRESTNYRPNLRSSVIAPRNSATGRK